MMDAALLDNTAVTAEGVRVAARRLQGIAVCTPLIESSVLNEMTGGRVLLKAEVLQHCGSFKFRGAYNLISQLNDDERRKGVLAWSSGNHAQGVALAARMAGIHATIIMPEDAPLVKSANVKALGADIITYDRYNDDREEVAANIVAEKGMALAPPYDHPHIIEGQGTAAFETFEEACARGLSLDAFLVSCGGGGLTSGSATILKDASPETEVWIAEPEGFDESWASIRDGVRRFADVKRKTICDAIATPSPGWLTLPIMERLVLGGFAVTDKEVRRAMAFAYQHLKLVVEPGGAAAIAGLLAGKFDVRGKTVAVVLSGGNVDARLFASIFAES